MKYIQAMVAAVCLFIVSGAIGAVRADDRDEEDQGVVLYTPSDTGDLLICRAVNVSDKTLGITIAVINHFGQAISCASPTTCTHGSGAPNTNPTPEVQVLKGTTTDIEITLPAGGPAQDGYCAFAVSGTGDRDDLRVSLGIRRTTTIPGTTIPVFLSRIVEGH
jgi:hypothetical protein